MSKQFCDKEAAIIRAARSGIWEPALRTHHNSCVVCREAAKVVTAMSILVLAEAGQIPPPPDPQRVWLKAAFAERQKRSVVITRIAAIVYAALLAVCGLAIYSLVRTHLKDSVAYPVTNTGSYSYSFEPILLAIVMAILLIYLFSPTSKKTR